MLDSKFKDLHIDNDNTRILDKHGHKIKTDELTISKGKTSKDKANRATVENVLDPRTMKFLKALTSRGIISDFNGCLSTGKEANVYHAFAGENTSQFEPTENEFQVKAMLGYDNHTDIQNDNESIDNAMNDEESTKNDVNIETISEIIDDEKVKEINDKKLSKNKKEYAIKIYKTSILVFKDRERYVDGEFRFRNSRSQHNPRKMIKIWAEKEFRNLKRIYQSKVIPVPKPIEVKSNVLVMEFLNRGNGSASPRLRDYQYKDIDDIYHYYYTMVVYMRLLYQICRLVHADLSEYNTLVHHDRLFMIDVSQSVEPEHPMSLDFLRMDIKNVNDYFQREGIEIFPERIIFQFVISETLEKFQGDYSNEEDLTEYIKLNLPVKKTEEDEMEDQVFRSLHLVRNLGGLEERDFDRYTSGKFDLLKGLIAHDNEKNFSAAEQFGLDDTNVSDHSDFDEDSDDEENEDDEESEYEDESEEEKVLKGKKYEDKDAKKLRKQEVKEAKREKRKTKIKKHVKKKLVNKTKSNKN